MTKILSFCEYRARRQVEMRSGFTGIQIPATSHEKWLSGLASIALYKTKTSKIVKAEYLMAAQTSQLFYPTGYYDRFNTVCVFGHVDLYDIANLLRRSGIKHAHEHVWCTSHTRAVADIILSIAVYKRKTDCDLINKVLRSAKFIRRALLNELEPARNNLDREEFRKLETFLSLIGVEE